MEVGKTEDVEKQKARWRRPSGRGQAAIALFPIHHDMSPQTTATSSMAMGMRNFFIGRAQG